MYIEWTENHTKKTIVGIVLSVVVLVLLIGFFKGRDIARSKSTVKQVVELQVALQNFFDDNDRYPTEVEFEGEYFSTNYLGSSTPKSIITKKCPEEISYRTFDRKNYTLNFCIPRDLSGLLAGENSVNYLDSLEEYLK